MLISNKWRDAILYENDGTGSAGAVDEVTTETVEDEFDKERALETIRKLRGFEKDAKALRKKLDEIEAAEKQRQDQELSEAEQAKKRADEAEAKLKDVSDRFWAARIQDAITIEATRLNFIDPEDAYKFVDDDAIDVDEAAGKVTGAKKALEALAKAKPYLVKQAGSGSINANDRGRATEPTVDELVQRKRSSGLYQPL